MRLALLLVTVISLGLVRAPVVRADDAAYDNFISEALAAYDAGRWTEARTAFRRAHALAPTARTFRTIGMCSFNLGDYVDALQNLDGALNDTRKPLTADQRTQVGALIERSSAKIGRFRLKLAPEAARVTVDGGAPALLGGRELLLEPGRHDVVASADGYRAARRELSVEPGDRATLDLQLEPGAEPQAAEAPAPGAAPAVPAAHDAAPEAAPPSAAATAPAAEPARGGGDTQRVLGIVSLGLGGAGLVAFGVAGGLALDKKASLDDACPDRKCGPAQHDEVDSYDTLRTASTVGLIAGGAFLTAGLVLLLTADDGASSEHAALVPELGLGWAGVRGRL
jgi:hypothetical protein